MKKLMGIVAIVLAFAMLASPVFAIGPQTAENNPNVKTLPYGVSLDSAGGAIHQEWINTIDKHVMMKNASEFQILDATVVTSISQVAQNENKWLYFSPKILGDWLAFVYNAAPGSATYIGLHMWALKNYPDGCYYREVFVGA